MHALARLIEDVMAAQGWNQAEVARRIGASSSRISQLLGDPVKRLPNRASISNLARGLGVPDWVVVDTYLEALGLPRRPNAITIDDAIAADVTLSAANKHALKSFADLLRNEPPARPAIVPWSPAAVQAEEKRRRHLEVARPAAYQGDPELSEADDEVHPS